jgi:hypothetical protein
MPLPAHLFRETERELRDFPITLLILRQRREEALTPDYLHTSPGVTHHGRNRLNKASGPSDLTCSTALRLCARDICEMEAWCNAVADTYAALSEELRSMVRLYYWQRNSAAGVAGYLGVDVDTLRDWREEVAGAVRERTEELQ